MRKPDAATHSTRGVNISTPRICTLSLCVCPLPPKTSDETLKQRTPAAPGVFHIEQGCMTRAAACGTGQGSLDLWVAVCARIWSRLRLPPSLLLLQPLCPPLNCASHAALFALNEQEQESTGSALAMVLTLASGTPAIFVTPSPEIRVQ